MIFNYGIVVVVVVVVINLWYRGILHIIVLFLFFFTHFVLARKMKLGYIFNYLTQYCNKHSEAINSLISATSAY
jgi:hypothetical protein